MINTMEATMTYTSDFDRDAEYYEEIETPTLYDYRDMLRFKDKGIALYDKRWQAAKAVIDRISEELEVHNKGHYLYALGLDDQHPIIDKMNELLSRGGDKVKLKKRVDELEAENQVLRTLIGK